MQKQSLGVYLLRAVKHLVKLIVLVALLVAVMYFTKTLAVAPADLLGTRGVILGIAVLVIAAAYPLYGFSTASARASLTDNRTEIVEALARSGYTLTSEGEDEMVFRATSGLKRLMQMGDDAIVLKQQEWGNISISGVRKEVENVRFRIEGYIHRANQQ